MSKILYTILPIVFLEFGCQPKVEKNVFKNLHLKIYRSIEISNSSKLYDLLAGIFTKKELELHFNHFSTFHKKNRSDNIKITIDDVEYYNIDVDGKSVQAHWVVRGRIFHNGHTHYRSLEYKALYNLTKEGEKWKISDTNIIAHSDFELTKSERETKSTK